MKRARYRSNRRVYCGRSRTAKLRYKTLADAKVARSHFESKRSDPLRIYKCPECKGYHLTSEPEWSWEEPDSAVSSRDELDDPEENRDDRL